MGYLDHSQGRGRTMAPTRHALFTKLENIWEFLNSAPKTCESGRETTCYAHRGFPDQGSWCIQHGTLDKITWTLP